MELRKFEIDGREIEFVNAWRGTRSGFAHDTTLFIDGRKWAEATCHYLNRTWERYTYQTVMRSAVYDLIERAEQSVKTQFMQAKGYKKITANRKAELEEAYKADENIRFYKAIQERLA